MLIPLTCFVQSRCFVKEVNERDKFLRVSRFYPEFCSVAQGECERGTEWKIEWGKKGHKFELPNKAVGKSVKDEF